MGSKKKQSGATRFQAVMRNERILFEGAGITRSNHVEHCKARNG